jgi:hypothetical protein
MSTSVPTANIRQSDGHVWCGDTACGMPFATNQKGCSISHYPSKPHFWGVLNGLVHRSIDGRLETTVVPRDFIKRARPARSFLCVDQSGQIPKRNRRDRRPQKFAIRDLAFSAMRPFVTWYLASHAKYP